MYDQAIGKNVPWDGNELTGNLPVKGSRVEEFIKDQLNSKMGVIYYDNTGNRNLIFADAESRDKYLEDPTSNAALVLGAFDAQAQYAAEIKLSTPGFNAILLGATGNTIKFTFDIKNMAGSSVGDDVTCTYTITRGGSKKVITEKYRNNTEVSFNIDSYLAEGTNTITINIIGNNTLAGTTIGVTYQVVNLVLSSTYNISTVHNLFTTPDSVAEIPYYISGTGTKTLEWYLDGQKLDFESTDEVVEVTSERTKYISMSGLTQGAHSIQARAFVNINGESFYSNTLYMDALVYTAENRDPLIGISTVIPSEHGIASPGALTIYGIEQFIPYIFQFTVYSPTGTANIESIVTLDGVQQGSVLSNNGDVIDYTITSTTSGTKSLRIVAGEKTTYEATISVDKSSSGLEENNNNLALNLSAVGRTNNDGNRESWVFGDYTTTFTGFNWNNTSGWVNNRLVISDGSEIEIDLAPFATRTSTTSGLTLELEFSTSQVNNESAILCDLRNSSGKGLLLTASEASLSSSGDAMVSTKFKSGENIRIAFVINPATGATNKGLVFIYIDGILSGASNYAENDNFLSDTLLKIGGTTEAVINLKQIRIYNSALGSDAILNNYILYRDSSSEMLDIFNRNNILDGRVFDLDALASQCPVLKITGNIPTLENTTDKDETIYVDVEYINMQDPDLSFTGTYLRMKPQGTSSMGYPKKNFRLYTAKHDDSKIFDATGKEILSRKYSFKKGSQPVDCWCFKADYAESSGTHNTGIARLWNKVMYDAQINGEYKLRTEAQKKALENNYNYDVRTAIDGFPCHLVYRLNENSDWIYIGKYNFNNDKSTESVFGFTGIPGFENTRMQCWEVLNNGNHLALFEDTTNFDTDWKDAFESRYPDTKTPALTDLKAFCEWVVSTKGNVEKFKTEKWNHLDVYKAAAYYVYVMRFGAVDQLVKNSMLTSEDGEHFYWINYDNDTINGLRNDGLLVFDYLIDRDSLDPSYTDEEVFVYAGHNSTLWNNMEADEEFMAIVVEVDQALYTAGLKYSEVINMFDNQQSSKWCERVYNQDAQYKYIGPYNDKGTNNLFMLQGARRSHRRWWLSHRFDLMDSKFISGKYKANIIDFKVMNDTPEGQKFTIRSGNLLYYGYGVNDVPAETGVKLDKGEEYTFTTTQNLNIGDPVRIYSAQNIQKLDLSPLMNRLTQLGISGVYETENGSQLKELILGNGVSVNSGLSEISGLDQAVSLEVLDIRGMIGLSSVNLSKIKTLKSFYAQNSGLTSFAPAEGSMLNYVSLPSTLRAMTLKSLVYLQNINVENAGRNLTTIQINNCAYLTENITFFLNWYDNKTTEDRLCSLDLDNVNWSGITPEQLIRLGQLKKNGGILKLKGRANITESNEEIVSQLTEIFGANCFDQSADFFILAPDAIYLTGPDSLMEGSTAQFTAAVFSEYQGSIQWSITSGGTSYQSIDQYGLLTTKYQGSERTITIQAKHIPTQGSVTVVTKSIKIIKQIRPTGGTIIGDNYASNGSKYSLTVSPSGINTDYSVSWSLSGTAFNEGNVSISSQNNENCTLACVGGKTGSFNVIATITDCAGNTKTVTKSVDLGVKVTISIKSNQDADTAVSSIKATVTANGTNYSVGDGDSVYTGSGSTVKVVYPSLTGYKKPDDIEYVLGNEGITITGTYYTEILTVNVSSWDGGASGYSITISNVGTQTNSTGVYKIPFGTVYTISASKLPGYASPKTITNTASELNREINLVYTDTIVVLNGEIDLSKQDIYGASISRSTANCYIVKNPGEYCFPLVYGNAIKNGSTNSSAFSKVEGSYSHDFVNHLDAVITDPYIANNSGCVPKEAELSMSDTDNVFSDVYAATGADGYYIRFTVTQIPVTGANAVISIMDATGVIMWSWHIWVWSDDLTPVTITNKTNNNYGILPVNLGSKWDDESKTKIKNWFYQWGRPTPMICPASYNSSKDHTNYGVKSFTKTSKADTIGVGIQNPNKYYYNSSSPYNWFGSASYYNLWDANCINTGNSDNNVVKTIYDPCPVGFKIPNGNTFTYFSTSNVVGSFANGWYFKRNSEDTSGVFFPASGHRYSDSGGLGNVGSSGYCWCSSSSSQSLAYTLTFGSGSVNPQTNGHRAFGFSVRPALE